HLRQVELRLGIEIRNRGNRYQLIGSRRDVTSGEAVLTQLFNQTVDDTVTSEHVHLALAEHGGASADAADDAAPSSTHDEVVIRTKRGVVRGRGLQQKAYLKAIATHDLNFGVGPAGTGKTY